MKFLRNLLAAILGYLIAVFLLMLVVILIFGVMASIGDKPKKIAKNTFLMLKLDKPIVDKTMDNPLEDFDFFTFKPKKKLGLNKILCNIEKAKNDDNITGIYMNLFNINANYGGWATIEEIRNKLLEFKSSGKHIYAYGELGLTENAYYLATVADSIFLNHQSYVELNGLGGTITFLAKTAKKIGLEPQVVRVGKFKSAAEQFTNHKMSRENREQITRYIQSIWGHVTKKISGARNLPSKKLTSIINKSPIHTPRFLLDNGLIDGIKYKDEIITLLCSKTKVKKNKKPRLVSLSKYAKVVLGKKKKKSKGKIAVVYAQGGIDNSGKPGRIGPELAKTLRKIRENDKIKAVVLRINSPGGSAAVSDFIWREVDLLKKEKPVIASMGNVAASGGYYIACAANKIVASDNTITGSIGVFGLFFSGKDFYEKKAHFTFDEVKTNTHANFMGGSAMGLPFSTRAMNSQERKIVQGVIDDIYEVFISHVASGRSLAEEEVKKIAQGRVWIGTDAKELGLVDEIGGLKKAIELAKTEADLEDFTLVEYPKEKEFIKQLIEDFTSNISEKILKKELGPQYTLYKESNKLLQMQGHLMRLPYDVEIR